VLVAIVLLARIFTAITLPDTAYTDTLYHLAISKEIANTGTMPFHSSANELVFQGISGALPPPFFHVVVADFFVISGTSLSFDLIAFFPIVVVLLELAIIFLICRQFFAGHKKGSSIVLLAFLFAAIQPVFGIYSSVNYPDSIATLFVLFSFYLIMKFDATKNPAFLFLLPFSISAAVLSKLTATILLPVFLAAIIYCCVKSNIKHAKKIAAIAVILTIVLSGFWFFADFQRSSAEHPEWGFFQKLFPSNSAEVSDIADSTISFESSPLKSPVDFIVQFNESFWFFLPVQFQSNIPFMFGIPMPVLIALFTIITLPLLAVALYGFVLLIAKREKYWLLILLLLLFGAVPFVERLQSRISIRMLLVLLPFFGIFFARGLLGLKSNNSTVFKQWNILPAKNHATEFIRWFLAILKKPVVEKIVLALLVLAVVYSAGFMIFTALYYEKSLAEARPAYEFIKTLPDDSRILAQRHFVRHIIFFTGHDANRDWNEYAKMNPEEFYSLLSKLKKESHVDYLLSTCSKNPWNPASLGLLEKEGKLSIVFESACSKVHEIKN
jgi:4-amino-4-deoxy-L-arabinose transferase-like glycosyltransferase